MHIDFTLNSILQPEAFIKTNMHLSNECNFGNVHGIMNTSGLLQIK